MASEEPRVYPVEEFNRRLRGYLRRVRDIWVEGELAELRRSDGWATVFLTLKGPSGATLAVQIQRRRFEALELELTEGELIRVRGDVDLWEQRGQLVFRAAVVERAGTGDLLARLERLKRALAAEGIFDVSRKKALPRVPRVIGLLTGTDGAALGDIHAALAARFPATTLLVHETRVQGDSAPEAIVAGLAALQADGRVDVIVLARGGGSLSDLLPFSDERVVRAVAQSRVPVVSAIGHEQDTPLCDLAADMRAATPTAAVRLVVPDLGELRAGLELTRRRLSQGMRTRSGRDRERLGAGHLRLRTAVGRALERDRTRLARARERLTEGPARLLERRRAALDTTGARLQALAPAATLARGYAIVRSDGTAIRRADAVATGSQLEIMLAAGALDARVEGVHP